jgi:formylglycine-generating enzyme required for sulfatase activity
MDTIQPKHIYSRIIAILMAITLAAPAPAQSCAGDLDGNGVINGADLGQLVAAWGPCESCAADLNANGVVDGADLGVQLGNWGECVTIPTWATVVQAQPDPAVVTDPALRAAIIATGRPWRVRDTATQVEMLLVPPGTFQMGCIMPPVSYECFGSELPARNVTLTNPYYLGRYEVTQSQWMAVVGSNPSYCQGELDSDIRPVETVSWNAIQRFLSASGFRLPTEAEWEYACRAGTQTPFYDGSTDFRTQGFLAWAYFNCPTAPNCCPQPIGGKLANGFGFHDMLGNVFEWVNDWYSQYPREAQTNPTGPELAEHRVVRGGSIAIASLGLTSSYRNGRSPGHSDFDIGFRVARNP